MKIKWRSRVARSVLKSGVLVLVATGAVHAQSTESILRARERLQLSDEQVQELDAMRQEDVRQRAAEAAEIAELRSQLEAGQIRRSELLARLEDQRDARRARAADRRARIDGLLNEEQRQSLQELRRGDRRPRPGARGERPDVRRRGAQFDRRGSRGRFERRGDPQNRRPPMLGRRGGGLEGGPGYGPGRPGGFEPDDDRLPPPDVPGDGDPRPEPTEPGPR